MLLSSKLNRWLLVYGKSYNKLHLSTAPSTEKWDLASSVCLERKPILTKSLNDIERKYAKLLSEIEFENSFKSDHEIRIIKDQLYAEELKKSDSFLDKDQVSLQTAQEFEDLSEEELKSFKFAQRTTEEDKKQDFTSTNRKLSNSLLLVVKQKFGNNSNWVLPQGLRREGETMRQTAERVLKENCGNDLHVRFLGNAPCGFYKYKYPKKTNTNQTVGMKVFFFKAQLMNGNVSKEDCTNFQWLAQDELGLLQEDYLKSVKLFLINDSDEE